MKISNLMKHHYWDMDTHRYVHLLEYEGKVRRDRRVPRCALRVYKYSTFIYLYSSGNNQAMLNATGHDHRSFAMLLEKFKCTFDNHLLDHRTEVR